MTTTHSLEPHPINDRILALDVLRGFALFGILYAHMIFWYAAGPLPQETYQLNKDIGSGVAAGIYMLFIFSKFFAIFSFLFGLSFYIQIRNLAERHQPVVIRFAWRLAILGVIGVLHHVFWRADILSIYVPLGFLLLFCRNLSNKTLLAVGALLVLNIPTKIAEIISLLLRGQLELITTDPKAEAATYYEIISNGSFHQMLYHNLHAMIDKYIYQINTGRLLITFGFFLLGMYAGRMKWFEDVALNHTHFKKVFKQCWKMLALVFGIVIVVGITVGILKIDLEKQQFVRWLLGFLFEIFNASLTLIYITGISLLLLKPKWLTRLRPLASVGKMALTTYLSQSLIGVFLFFNLGAGLFLVTTPAQNALLCLGIFILQMMICRAWLNYFQYGPIEWVWRSATDLKLQPFKKDKLFK